MADYLIVPTSRLIFRPSHARFPCSCSSFPNPLALKLNAAMSRLFVIGDAATLVTDACLDGQLRSWFDRARFWHLVLQNSNLSLRGIPDRIVGSLTYRIVD